jgi:hypothetical protein
MSPIEVLLVTASLCLMAYFADDQHALTEGMLIGTLMEAGINVSIETDAEGNYTDIITVRLPDEEGMPPITIRLKVLA